MRGEQMGDLQLAGGFAPGRGASSARRRPQWARVSCYLGLVNTQQNLLPAEHPGCKYCLLLDDL